MIEIKEKSKCCGCTACKSVCPQNAINMIEDNEGFLYPKINKEKCIQCNLCDKVCPIKNKNVFSNFEQRAYIFQNLNEDIRNDSTSGGFFSKIGEYVINKGGIVYGVAYDYDFKVIHKSAQRLEELKKFRKSKYVQSNLNNTFNEIKGFLENNKMVCFSGTPCQVAGLKKYLNKEYDNLILVDIMCHSVPSPLFFEKYKKYILNKLNATKILDINFRDKKKYGYKYSMMTVVTDNGEYSEGIDTDPYLRAFFGDLSVRPSCYECNFKTQKRVSDITIWDCFNISEIDKDFDDDKGTTRILIQTQKGLAVLQELDNVKIKELDVNIAVNNVKEMNNSVKINPKRQEFWNSIDDINLIEKFFPINLTTKLNSLGRKTLSKIGLYTSIKKMTKKILRK